MIAAVVEAEITAAAGVATDAVAVTMEAVKTECEHARLIEQIGRATVLLLNGAGLLVVQPKLNARD